MFKKILGWWRERTYDGPFQYVWEAADKSHRHYPHDYKRVKVVSQRQGVHKKPTDRGLLNAMFPPKPINSVETINMAGSRKIDIDSVKKIQPRRPLSDDEVAAITERSRERRLEGQARRREANAAWRAQQMPDVCLFL